MPEYTLGMATPVEKGNALEAAVAAIEAHILRTTPGLGENTFLIESKKTIKAGGVHHEIDVFVTIDLGNGYRSVFIFECKNWRDPVGKNEVIVFSEKIAAAQAQHGYLIGRSFTKDACFQAEKDSRVILSTAVEHDPLLAERPFEFHFRIQALEHVEVSLHRRGSRGELALLDIDTSCATHLGNLVNLREYILNWGNQAASEDARSFRSERVPEGQYPRTAHSKREFVSGDLVVDNADIERAELSARYTVRVVRPALISYFEVKSRGRVVSFAPVQFNANATMQTRLICP
jgi:hypothetical protein